MNVGELVDELKNWPPDAEVIISHTDDTMASPLCSVMDGMYQPDQSWCGTLYCTEEFVNENRHLGYTDEDLPPDTAEFVVVLDTIA